MSLDGASLLKADRVGKVYADADGSDVVALSDISLAIGSHEFVSILGPSGCGKSTFLRIVAGLDRPTSGRIEVEGREVTGPGADRGMVFQDYALLPWKTTLANIAFGLQLKGIAKEDALSATPGYDRGTGVGSPTADYLRSFR